MEQKSYRGRSFSFWFATIKWKTHSHPKQRCYALIPPNDPRKATTPLSPAPHSPCQSHRSPPTSSSEKPWRSCCAASHSTRSLCYDNWDLGTIHSDCTYLFGGRSQVKNQGQTDDVSFMTTWVMSLRSVVTYEDIGSQQTTNRQDRYIINQGLPGKVWYLFPSWEFSITSVDLQTQILIIFGTSSQVSLTIQISVPTPL